MVALAAEDDRPRVAADVRLRCAGKDGEGPDAEIVGTMTTSKRLMMISYGGVRAVG